MGKRSKSAIGVSFNATKLAKSMLPEGEFAFIGIYHKQHGYKLEVNEIYQKSNNINADKDKQKLIGEDKVKCMIAAYIKKLIKRDYSYCSDKP